MAHPLARLMEKRPLRVLGLMSGTSVDGIDCALVEIDGRGRDARATLVASRTRPYSTDEKALIHGLFEADARALTSANFQLGELFADAALALLAAEGLRPADVDLVGSHGQTIWHTPPSSVAPGQHAGTLQLAEPAVIAARTGLVTVADFRVADVAVGGEGAPLVPYADWVLFRAPGRRRALQNVGGIANVALVGERLEDTIAFDNGPGNMMLDALMPLVSGGTEEIDRGGAWSAQGTVQEDLLAGLLDDDYLRRAPPKSTGRERYGRARTLAWAEAHRDRRPVDLLRTLVELTARAIAASYRFLPAMPDEVLVSGGGAHNATLMAALARLLGATSVRPLGDAALVDAKEAIAFALLAVACVDGVPANVPSVTGAARPAILGKLALP